MAPDLPLVAVLAAGRARRFGGGKLDAQCGGKRLGQWALDAVAAAGLAPGLIVVGAQAPQFARAAQGWRLVTNPAPEAGQGGSVALAAREAIAQGRALLLLLADMPLIAPDHLRRVAQCGTSAATRYPDGRIGVPACIGGGELGRLLGLTGDKGASAILPDLAGLEVIAADPATLLDVDSEADLLAAARRLATRA